MVKSVLSVVLAAFAFAASPRVRAEDPPAPKAQPRGIIVDRVAAVVNDTIVLESEVVQRAGPAFAELENTPEPQKRQQRWRQIVRQVVETMVDEELVVQAAVEAKLEVTEDEVTRALDEVKRQNKITDKQFETALSQQGYTMADYRKDIRRQMVRLRAVNVLVRPRVQVSDTDLRTRYEKLSGQSATVTEVKVRHILLALPEKPSAEEMDKARKRAGELVARIRAGEDFATLAGQFSDDAQSKAAGGVLGTYKRNELPTEWEEILFAMAPNEVRGPVRGPRGVHVFQVLENKKEAVRAFDEVKETLREQIFTEEMEKQTKVWLQELRKRAHIEVKI